MDVDRCPASSSILPERAHKVRKLYVGQNLIISIIVISDDLKSRK